MPAGNPVPTVSLVGVPVDPLIGDQFSFTTRFDNTGATASDVGYAPYVNLFLPATGADGGAGAVDDGVSFVSATYLGVNVKSTVITLTAAGVPHPYAKDAAGNPVIIFPPAGFQEGDQLVVLQLPFGSFTPDQPPADLSVTVKTSNLADRGTPLPIIAQGGFSLGSDPLDNPAADPPILGPAATTTVSPELFRLKKTYLGPENETVTGPNYPRQYRIDVDVATGQTITNLDLTDVLPANMQFVSFDQTLINGAPASSTAISTPGLSTPGGTLTRRLASVTGTSSAADASMLFTFYIPRNDASNQPIVDPVSGSPGTSANNAKTAGVWDPIDQRDPQNQSVSIDPPGPEHVLTDKALAVQKTATVVGNTGPAGPTPGDIVDYTITGQISDYFAFNQVTIDDLLGDGIRFFPGFVPTLAINGNGYTLPATAMNAANFQVTPNFSNPADGNPNDGTDGTTGIRFFISDELATRGQSPNLVGGLVNPTTGASLTGKGDGPTSFTLHFRAQIQDFFSDQYPLGSNNVNQGDVLDNHVDVSGDVLQNTTGFPPTGQTATDNSAASLTVPGSTVQKSIYAINGNPVTGTTPPIFPGDRVTYRLTYNFSTTDVQNLRLTDYLPLPVYSATEVTTLDYTRSSVAPPAGTMRLLPSDTTSQRFPGIVPTLVTDAVGNTVGLNYGNLSDPGNQPSTIDAVFTVTASDKPFSDGLLLTNQVQSQETTKNGDTTSSNGIVQVELQEPVVDIYKGVVGQNSTGSTLGGITFTAPSAASDFTGTVSNKTQASAIGAADQLGNILDAGDKVRYAVVAQNTGRSDAFDVRLSDAVPAGYQTPANLAAMNLVVRRGDGTLLTLGTDYTATLVGANLSIELTDNYSSGNVSGDTRTGALSRGIVGGVNIPVTNGSNTVVVTYDLTLAGTVTPNQTITNTSSLTNFAGAEGGPDHTTVDKTDTASVNIKLPKVAKTLVGTSLNDATNSNSQATIGEVVSYTLTMTIPEGITPAASIVDTLPPGLAFVGVDSVVPSSGVSFTGNLLNPTVGGGGTPVTFDLGDVTNANTINAANDTITITYRAVVLNVGGNNAGTQLTNSARASFTGGSAGPVSAANVTVIVPTVSTTKQVRVNGTVNGTGDAGDPVQYTITYSNPASNSTTAYNVTVNDPIPASINGATIASVSGAATTADFQLVGGAVVSTDPAGLTLLPGRSVTIVVTGTLVDTIGPGIRISNTATTTYTTMPGDVTQVTPNNPNSSERTLTSSGNAAFTTVGLTPKKSLVSTSESSTTGSDVVVGEIVRYRLQVIVPEGSSPVLQFTDNLPAGLQFLNDNTADVMFVSNGAGIVSSSLSGAGLVQTGNETTLAGLTPIFVIPGGSITGGPFNNGTDPTFSLGNVTNNDRDPDQEFAVIEFNALVTNVATNQDGVALNNTFTGKATGSPNATSANVPVTVREPRVTTAKTAVPTTVAGGQTVSYSVVYANTGSATAFDVTTTDTIPAPLVLVPGSVTVIPAGGATVNVVGNSISVDFPTIGAGQSITITYQATVPNTLTPNQALPNTAVTNFTSLPGTSGTAPNSTGSIVPGGSGSPTGERNGTDGVGGPLNDYRSQSTATVTAANPVSITKVIQSTSVAETIGNQLTIGEQVTYRVTFRLPNVTFPTLNLTDAIPTNLTYLSSSIVSIGSNTTVGATSSGVTGSGIASSPLAVGAAGTLNAGVLGFSFNGLVNNGDGAQNTLDDIVIDVTGRVRDAIPPNSGNPTFNNTATLNFGPGSISATAPAKVVEPILSIAKSTGTPRVDANDIVTYSIVINHTGASGGPAFDTAITDSLTPGINLIPGSVTTTAGTIVTGNGAADNSIAVTVPVIPLGTSVLITYQARISTTPSPGTTLTNTANLRYDSLPNTGPDERVQNTSDPATVTVNSNTISGFVYVDANNNGVKDTGEAPIPGTAVTLTGTDHLGNPISVTAITLGNGGYSFTGLRPGSYQLDETHPSGFLDGLDTPGANFGGASVPPPGDTIRNIVVSPGSNTTGANYNFGERIAADIAVTKTVSNNRPNVGDSITFTLTATNNGPSDATGVVITDKLPAGLTFVSASPGGVYNPATGAWTIGALANGATSTLTITATVAGPNASTNVATVTASNQLDPNPNNNRDQAVVTPLRADLAVTKSVSNTAPNVGDTVTYTIVLVNNGPDDANNITLSDPAPAGISYQTATVSAGSFANPVWSLPSLLVGQSATLTITALVTAPSPATNTASITGATEFDPVLSNNTSTATLAPLQADLSVTKVASDPRPNVGDVETYTVVVSNLGPNAATNAVLNDAIPAGLTGVTLLSVSQGAFNSGTGVWTIGGLGLNATATLRYRATVNSATPQTNTVTVGADQFDPVPANNSANATVTPQRTDLAVAKAVSNNQPNEGEIITYTVTLTNNGPDAATGVKVTDVPPAGLTLVSATPSQGTYAAATGVWTVGALAAGQSRSLVYTAKVVTASIKVNTARLTAIDQFDTNPNNNADSETVTPRVSDVAVVKDVSDPTPNVGETITYTVRLTNNGPVTATSIKVVDVPPAGLTRLTVTSPGGSSFNAATSTWTVLSLAPGASTTLTYTARVDSPNPQTNTARITDLDQFDLDPTNNQDSATETPKQADLQIDKQIDNARPNVGDTVTYTINLGNIGPDDATGVTATDQLPAGVQFISSSATRGSFNNTTGIWTVGNLAVGETVTLTIVAMVTSPQPGTNQVSTTSEVFDPVLSNNNSSSTFRPLTIDLSVDKTINDPTPNVGDIVTFTLVAQNAGPSTATNTVVSDPLPAGVTFVSSSATQGSYSAATGIWSIGTLARNQSRTLAIRARVTTPGFKVNLAVVAARQFDINLTNNIDFATLTPQQADLAVTKVVDNPRPNVGDLVTYTVSTTNNGVNDATNVRVTDPIPVGVQFVSSSSGAYNPATGVWTVGSLAVGATATLTVQARVVSPNPSTNTAKVTGDQFEPDLTNNSASATITPQVSDLRVRKRVDNATPQLNGIVNFTVELTNLGPDDATGVTLADRLPPGLLFIAATPDRGMYDNTTGVWTIGNIANGETLKLVIQAQVTQTTSQVNTATLASSDQFDSNPNNNTASATVGARVADLELRKTTPARIVTLGSFVPYTFTITNNGPFDATNVVVTDVIPAGLQYRRVIRQSAGTGAFDPLTGQWNVGSLAAGATVQIVIEFIVRRTGTITNTATVSALEFDPILQNNTSSARISGIPQGLTKGRFLGGR